MENIFSRFPEFAENGEQLALARLVNVLDAVTAGGDSVEVVESVREAAARRLTVLARARRHCSGVLWLRNAGAWRVGFDVAAWEWVAESLAPTAAKALKLRGYKYDASSRLWRQRGIGDLVEQFFEFAAPWGFPQKLQLLDRLFDGIYSDIYCGDVVASASVVDGLRAWLARGERGALGFIREYLRLLAAVDGEGGEFYGFGVDGFPEGFPFPVFRERERAAVLMRGAAFDELRNLFPLSSFDTVADPNDVKFTVEANLFTGKPVTTRVPQRWDSGGSPLGGELELRDFWSVFTRADKGQAFLYVSMRRGRLCVSGVGVEPLRQMSGVSGGHERLVFALAASNLMSVLELLKLAGFEQTDPEPWILVK